MKRIHGLIGLLVLLTASGCGVIEVSSPIKEGQRVRIDPCAILTKADAEALLGSPATDPSLKFWVAEDADPPDCIYERANGPDYGDSVSMRMRAETHSALRGIVDGAEWAPIGKNGRYATGKNGLIVDVLSKEGVQYELRAAVSGRQPEELLNAIKTLAPELSRRIDGRMKDRFEPPEPTAPPIDPCSLLPRPAVEPLVGTLPGEGPIEDRYETFGGHGGGSWTCEIYTRAAPEERCACNSTFVTLFKSSMTVEELKGLQGQAETVPGVGAHAYYVNHDLSVHSVSPRKANPSWLSGVTKNGQAFKVETHLHVPGGVDDVRIVHGQGPHEGGLQPEEEKRITIELAKLVLANMP